jgi:hypothetical protein
MSRCQHPRLKTHTFTDGTIWTLCPDCDRATGRPIQLCPAAHFTNRGRLQRLLKLKPPIRASLPQQRSGRDFNG